MGLASSGSAFAQQSRDDLARSLPSSNLSNDDVNASAKSLLPAPGFANAKVASNPNAPDATPIGEKTCIACHQLESEHFTHTLHALGLHAASKADASIPVCETCHGPGSAHAQSPTTKGLIIGYTKDSGTPIAVQTGTCLSCHQGGPRDHWLGSVHQRNGLSCSDCHNPMAKFSVEGLMAKASINDTCAQCHQRRSPAVQPALAHAAAGRPDELRRLPQPARLADQSAAEDEHGQRDLLSVPRREARPVPVRARAGARELPELPHAARLEPAEPAGRADPVPVPAMPFEPGSPERPADTAVAGDRRASGRTASWAAAASPATRTSTARMRRRVRSSTSRTRKVRDEHRYLPLLVVPAQAGTQCLWRAEKTLDSGLRRNDDRVVRVGARRQRRRCGYLACKQARSDRRLCRDRLRRARHLVAGSWAASLAQRQSVCVPSSADAAGPARRLAVLRRTAARPARHRRRRSRTRCGTAMSTGTAA